MNTPATRRRSGERTQTTLEDVARAAAVSTASASRALARPQTVSDGVRNAVLEAAAALGYVGNSAARALARRRSGWIGVIVGDLDGVITAPALGALEARLAAGGWAVLLATVGGHASSFEAAHTLLGQGVEALALVGVSIPDGLLPSRDAQRIPCVAVGQGDGGSGVGTSLDIGRAGALVVEYLCSLGHRRMALVAGPGGSLDELFGASVRAGCASAGASLEVLDPTSGFVESIARWDAVPNSPTVAVCASDALAVATLHACCRLGFDVPGRLSIVGFGDSALARAVSPRLTSVRLPAADAGLAAADRLLARLAGVPIGRRELPIRLALRASTGPARAE
ncbi:MAG: substrate-binding domain-containing protein [Pseudomonadota bacterium]|nr:substrate-binding domain-containing protein [Pseudomonadota bacterium]